MKHTLHNPIRFLVTILALCIGQNVFGQKAQQIESSAEFNEYIGQGSYPVAAYFYRKDKALKEDKERYRAHEAMKEMFHQDAPSIIPEVYFIKVNLADPKVAHLAEKYQITEEPTVLIFKHQKEDSRSVISLVARHIGYLNAEQLVSFIYKYLGAEIRAIQKEWQRLRELQQEAIRREILDYPELYWYVDPYAGPRYPYAFGPRGGFYYGYPRRPYWYRYPYGPNWRRYPYRYGRDGYGVGFTID